MANKKRVNKKRPNLAAAKQRSRRLNEKMKTKADTTNEAANDKNISVDFEVKAQTFENVSDEVIAENIIFDISTTFEDNQPEVVADESEGAVSGKRIVDLAYCTQKLLDTQYFHVVKCTGGKLSVIDEKRHGVTSIIFLQCFKCRKIFAIPTGKPSETFRQYRCSKGSTLRR